MRSRCNRNEDDDGNGEAFALQVTRKGFRRIVCVASYVDHIHTRTTITTTTSTDDNGVYNIFYTIYSSRLNVVIVVVIGFLLMFVYLRVLCNNNSIKVV